MTALAYNEDAPLMVALPDGSLVPASGSGVQAPQNPAIAALALGNGGALESPAINAAGAPGGVLPAGALPNSNVVAMNTRRVSPRMAGPMRMPDAPSPQGDGFDIDKIISSIAQNSGTTNAPALVPPTSAPAAAPAPAATPQGTQATGGGLLDWVTDLLHGHGTADASKQPATSDVPASNPTAGALANTPNAVSTAAPQAAQEPDFFTRLQSNPVAMALVEGGLATLSGSSAPGSAGRAVGEGALTGINSVYQQRVAQRTAALDAMKAQADAAHSGAEATLATAQAGAIPATTAKTQAEAAAIPTDTQAKMLAAQAAMQRASRTQRPIPGIGPDGHTKGFYLPSSIEGVPATFQPGEITGTASGKPSVSQWKHDAWLSAHPGDEQGALDYAAGHKTLGGGDIQKSALGLAQGELRAMMVPPDNPAAWVDNRAKEIATLIKQANTSSGGALPAPRAQTFTVASPAAPQSSADLGKLPKGAIYKNPADGKLYRKK